MKSLATTFPATGLPLYAQTITYDMADRIVAMARDGGGKAGSEKEQYRYDSFDHLSHADTLTEKTTWTYDQVGNRLRADIALPAPKKEALSYAPASNRLLTIANAEGQRTYDYDKAGNPIAIGQRKYGYGVTNRLQHVSEGSRHIADYAYNAFGERVSKTVSDSKGKARTTYFLYHDDRLESEIDETGAVIAHYLYIQGQPIAKLEYGSSGHATSNHLHALHADHLGTPRVASDSKQRITWQSDIASFGKTTILRNDIQLNLRFPGQYYDAETGMHYNFYRDYDAGNGRYIQSDPVGLAGGINTYAYVAGNPLSAIDPRGLDLVVITGGMRESTNPFGHIAIGVTGAGIYSYGNGTPLGSSVTTYIETQSALRKQTVTIIPATAAQDASALAYLQSQTGMNSVGEINNCAVRTNSVLVAAGFNTTAAPFPGSVARAAMGLPNANTVFVPKGGPITSNLLDALRPFAPPNVP